MLQMSDDQKNSQKDIKVMKTIHDLKNPIFAIQYAIQDIDSTFEQKKAIINSETLDLTEMLENLRAEFKCRQLMEFYEKPSLVVSSNFIESFLHAHSNLAQNGENTLELKISTEFPLKIDLQRMNVKRILNNLITNSLKHTFKGIVRINLSIEKGFNINNKTKDYQHVGNTNLNQIDLNYIAIEVEDTGCGIPPLKLPQVFDEKETDQSNNNWDGTGLGLSICSFICDKLGWSIRYTSNTTHSLLSQQSIPTNSALTFNTRFTLQIPYSQELGEVHLSQFNLSNTNQSGNNELKHICGEILLAEDSPNILKITEKLLTNRSLSFKSFGNGKLCYDQICKIECQKCKMMVVITDLSMPYMTGLELAMALKELPKYEFIIILSSAEEELVVSGLGYFDYIYPKPLNGPNLTALLNSERILEYFKKCKPITDHDKQTQLISDDNNNLNNNQNQNQAILNDNNNLKNNIIKLV